MINIFKKCYLNIYVQTHRKIINIRKLVNCDSFNQFGIKIHRTKTMPLWNTTRVYFKHLTDPVKKKKLTGKQSLTKTTIIIKLKTLNQHIPIGK